MASSERSVGGAKRSETVSVRLDPRLKYLAEVAARGQRRTLSGFVEWAVEKSLENVEVGHGEYALSVADADRALHLWDVEEADRVASLAFNFPELLAFEEQLIWRHVKSNGLLWRGLYDRQGEWVWSIKPEGLIADRLREHWDKFKKVAARELPDSVLPTWVKKKPGAPDDDIPF